MKYSRVRGRASQQKRPAHVRFGSGADITRLLSNVRFTLQSGQSADTLVCPLSAKTGLKLRRGCTPPASRERLRLRPGALRFVCRSISRAPPYAGRLVDAACWSDGAKFRLPLEIGRAHV